MKFLYIFLLLLVFIIPQNSYAQKGIIPKPQKIKRENGDYQLGKIIKIHKNQDVPEIKYLDKKLREIVDREVRDKKRNADIRFYLDKTENSKKNGSYVLTINNRGVEITASTNKGLFYGIQTLLQIIENHRDDYKLPYLKIEDYPKFKYRGMMLDVVRHFYGVEEVKRYLDFLATYKYNKFHWHLTGDQGWRIEIKSHPKLTKIGAWRDSTQVGRYFDYKKFDSTESGGYYTQNEVREIVDYAHKLHIDVIPEIEMPGHAQAAIASYPELGCTNDTVNVRKIWGVSDVIFCAKEKTFKFLEDVIDEIVELFPYKYIHIGGDEASKKHWKRSKWTRKLIKKRGLKDEEGLQSYFITRMEKYINSKGKQIIGWDEILQGGLAPNATVMSWRGEKGGVSAAKSKHKAIMTPTSTNYLDYYQGNPKTEPLAWGGHSTLKDVYSYSPTPTELDSTNEKYIWGTQGSLWTEYIDNFDKVEYMIMPRMMALSEVAWGTSNPERYDDFEERVINRFKILDKRGINYSRAIFEVEDQLLKKNGDLFYKLGTRHESGAIRYTTNGEDPTSDSKKYAGPIPINENLILKAAYFEGGEQKGAIISQKFKVSKSTGKNTSLENSPSEPYAENGALSLVDGIKGDINNHRTDWLGFKGDDVVVIIDLEKKRHFSNIQFSTLNLPDWNIYFPTKADVFVSDDGYHFKLIKSISNKSIKKANGQLNLELSKQKSRFVKLKLKNMGTIPKNLSGAGSKALILIDEISVN